PRGTKLRRQLVDDHKSDVVSRRGVLRAGISETSDEPDWRICFFHWYRAAVLVSGVKRSETKSKDLEELPGDLAAGLPNFNARRSGSRQLLLLFLFGRFFFASRSRSS